MHSPHYRAKAASLAPLPRRPTLATARRRPLCDAAGTPNGMHENLTPNSEGANALAVVRTLPSLGADPNGNGPLSGTMARCNQMATICSCAPSEVGSMRLPRESAMSITTR